jgi:Flp pilus assembly protein protease CpaA
MKVSHWVIAGGFLTAISVQIASLQSWDQATTPLFVAGVIGQIGTFLAAMFKDSPTTEK